MQNASVFDILTCKCAWSHSGVPFSTIFPHLNFKKWSEPVSFLTFWLANVLLATAACNFSTSELQKAVRPRWSSFYLLSSDSTSLLCFFIFWLCYSALHFQLSILSEVRLLNFLWSLFMVPHLEPLPEILPRIARIEGHKMQEQPLLLSQNSRKNRHFPSIHNS